MTSEFRSGFVTLVGRPNVGKSTLLNRVVGKKISITSRRPQTTRHRILGIKTTETEQIVFVDTPGLHGARGKAINQAINRTARASMEGVDVIILMIDATGWHKGDELPLRLARSAPGSLILAINKIDRLKDRDQLLPLIEESTKRTPFVAIVPISAQSGNNVDRLVDVIGRQLPHAPAGFPLDQITDRSGPFIGAEFIREQIFRQLGQELPYAAAVEVERFTENSKDIRIEAIIWVENSSHKKIIVGRAGERIKKIGTRARQTLEKYFEKPVHVKLWVKVRAGWADNLKALKTFGYSE